MQASKTTRNLIFGFSLGYVFSLGLLGSVTSYGAETPTLTAPGKVIIGIVSSETREDFDSKIMPFFKEQWSQCGNCELKNLSVYDEKGNLNERALLPQIEASATGVSMLFFNVNWRYKAEDHARLVELLKKLTASNTLVLATSGSPKEGESSAPLTRTVLGQVPDAIIVGEINERERLPATSFFGPEMLTAIRPPREYIGKGMGPAFFVSKLAQNYSRKLPHDWLVHFRNQKMKSRKIWPQVEDFFSRL